MSSLQSFISMAVSLDDLLCAHVSCQMLCVLSQCNKSFLSLCHSRNVWRVLLLRDYGSVWSFLEDSVCLRTVYSNFFTNGGRCLLENKHGRLLSLALSKDGLFLAAGDFFGNIFLWSLSTLSICKTMRENCESHKRIDRLYVCEITEWEATNCVSRCWSPNGKHIASIATNGTVRLWKVGFSLLPCNR